MFGKNPFNEYRATQQQVQEAVKYPHMMYDPKTGKEFEAKTPADHAKYAKMGYTHDKPKTESVQERTATDCKGMVCKNCGDKFGMPTEGSCMYDSKDPNGKNWKEAYNEATQYIIPEEIPANERTAFHGAAAAAAKAGKKSFNFGGKTHPVTMKKDTAKAIADDNVKEGMYKDMDTEKGEPNPRSDAKVKADMKKRRGDKSAVEMNPKMDTDKKAKPMETKESRIRASLKSVLAEKKNERDKHTKGATEPEGMMDKQQHFAAKEMMKAADAEIAKGPDAHLNEPEIDRKNFEKMTSNVKTSKMRKNDNPKGDRKIVPAGTQFKDPAAMKPEGKDMPHKVAEGKYDKMQDIKAAYASMYETYTHAFDYAEDGPHTADKFVAKAKKAGIKAKIHNDRGPGGGHPVVHLGHKDEDHMHKFLKKHYDDSMTKDDLKYNKIGN